MQTDPDPAPFFPRATYALLAWIWAMFVLELATHRTDSETALLALGALPHRDLHGEYWRLISYSFLHLNWNHILMNSILLWWTGRIVERRVGALQMIGVYFGAVLLASAHIAVHSHLHPRDGASVGASGGVFGLLGAAMVLAYRKDAVARFGKNPRIRLGLWIALAVGVIITFQPGVSVAGHVGGLFAGLILGGLIRVRPSATPVSAPA